MQRVGLHQHTLKLDRLQQLAQSLDLAAGISGVGGLGDRHAQRLGIEAHLGNETRCAGLVLGDGTPQRFAITNQGVEFLGHAWLGRHPIPQQAFKARHIQLGQQQPKRGIRGRLAEIGAQELVRSPRMTTSTSAPGASPSTSNGVLSSSLPRWRLWLSMLNWRRDPDVEMRIAESKMREQQLRRENALLDEKLRNFDALELRLKQAVPCSPTASTPPQSSAPSSSKP
jgi:hypothetical protein